MTNKVRKVGIESKMGFFIHATAIIDGDVEIGDGTRVWHFSHIQSGACIGSFCSLGQNVNVSNNVIIGNHVKIQNNVSIYEGVTIEDYVFCGPSCVFTNDLTPRSRYSKNHKYIPTIVRHDATIGANATIVCGHEIGRYATIAAGAVVTSDVPPHALMAGVPAKQIGWVCECGQVLKEHGNGVFLCPDCGRKYSLIGGKLLSNNSSEEKNDERGGNKRFHRLFIIGNGFDSAHKYKTGYYLFRDWMEEKLKEAYPDIETDDEGHIVLGNDPEIPFVAMGHHGEEIVDEKQSLYLLMWMLLLQMKSDDEWNRFEEELYYLDLEEIINNNDFSIEDNARDKEGDVNPFHADANYSVKASELKISVLLLPKLFEKWIEDIEISDIPKLPIGELMDEDSLYLSFNYTETLEKIYGIPGFLVDHIHGLRLRAEKYYDFNSVFPNTVGKIIVGHGEDASRDFDAKYIEKESILQETIRKLRKPVDWILKEHAAFWSSISSGSIKEVYSFGFSYADVDIPYIEQIVVLLQAGRDVIWYLNKYDDRPNKVDSSKTTNEMFEEIIRNCGFLGEFGRFD